MPILAQDTDGIFGSVFKQPIQQKHSNPTMLAREGRERSRSPWALGTRSNYSSEQNFAKPHPKSPPLTLKPRRVTQSTQKEPVVTDGTILAMHLALLEGQRLAILYPNINTTVVGEAFGEGLKLGTALRKRMLSPKG